MPKTIKFTFAKAKTIFEKHGWQLIDNFYKKNDYPHNAICKCGNQTKKRLNDLQRFPGCRKCGNNNIPTVAELQEEFNKKGCEFLDNFYINSHFKHNYKCNCGNISKINLNNWRNGKRCQRCGNQKVFDLKLPSNLYLLGKDNCFKIGINNRKSWRLVNHKKNGWHILDKLGPIRGADAKAIEKTILFCLNSKNIPLGAKAGLDKFDGYSECWLAKDLNVNCISDLWNKL